ncbi:baseplate J/gp47 family protein [Cellulomonas sp. PSBB021]|uniref:baseplate J/gp47 family protein n=1 Tax=Cellulomonas sp. PSBB021 TaxID=2003551 RepID=UPI0012FD74C9|nr:baseplate J/gp47 family protein [Cellulomonas sp. PSBB021]
MNGLPDGFSPRPYPEIVRDTLTTLTGGTVREVVTVPAGDLVVLDSLRDRPIRRVSHLQGVVEVTRPLRDVNGDLVRDAQGRTVEEQVPVPYRFTDADFEVVATGREGVERDAIRFRPTGRRPPTGSTVVVNYYPSQSRPAPVTDLSVGSVARTLLESVARELALVELGLDAVYRSAFLETAQGTSLDKVVALVGVARRPGGVPTARVRFTRAAGSTGRITVPVGTVVSDAQANRYATTVPLVLEVGEDSREVLAAALSPATAAVEAGALDRLEVLIAGVGAVTNESPAAAAGGPEPDDDLRRRARGALAVAARGTLDALRHGVANLEGVQDVTVTEFPQGLPGEVLLSVSYDGEPTPDLLARVVARVDDLRPAGVRVTLGRTQPQPAQVTATLVLAGSGVGGAELQSLQSALEERVAAIVGALPPGGTARAAQLSAAALSDPRIVDATFGLDTGAGPQPSVTAPTGHVLSVVRPFTHLVSTESGTGPGATVEVDALVPVHLAPGVTAGQAEQAMSLAARSWAAGLGPGTQISVDAFVAAVRDDTRYAVVRAHVALTTEAEGRFLRLADGLGTHALGAQDSARIRSVALDVREGGV